MDNAKWMNNAIATMMDNDKWMNNAITTMMDNAKWINNAIATMMDNAKWINNAIATMMDNDKWINNDAASDGARSSLDLKSGGTLLVSAKAIPHSSVISSIKFLVRISSISSPSQSDMPKCFRCVCSVSNEFWALSLKCLPECWVCTQHDNAFQRSPYPMGALWRRSRWKRDGFHAKNDD